MAKAGSVLDNPVTGEHYIILEAARETAGERLTFEMNIPAGFKIVPHLHPIETETLAVQAGILKITLNGIEKTVNVGEKVVIKPNDTHVWWNATPDRGMLKVVETLHPALGWETLFEQVFGLSQEGKVDKNGTPSVLQMAVSLNVYKDHVWFLVPIWIQRILIPLLAFVGRLQGLKPVYPKFSPDGIIPPEGVKG